MSTVDRDRRERNRILVTVFLASRVGGSVPNSVVRELSLYASKVEYNVRRDDAVDSGLIVHDERDLRITDKGLEGHLQGPPWASCLGTGPTLIKGVEVQLLELDGARQRQRTVRLHRGVELSPTQSTMISMTRFSFLPVSPFFHPSLTGGSDGNADAFYSMEALTVRVRPREVDKMEEMRIDRKGRGTCEELTQR